MRLPDFEHQRGPSDLAPLGDARPVNADCAPTLGNGLVAFFLIKSPRAGTLPGAATPPDEPSVGNQNQGGGVISPA